MSKSLYIAALTTLTIMSCTAEAPSSKKSNMKFNAGIVTNKLTETRAFYVDTLGFGISFENEFYLLLHSPSRETEISFLLPNHPTQHPIFHEPFNGKGMYLTIETEEVDKLYTQLKAKGVKIEIDIRNEPWGDRHFAIVDPNGIGIDIVKYTPVQDASNE